MLSIEKSTKIRKNAFDIQENRKKKNKVDSRILCFTKEEIEENSLARSELPFLERIERVKNEFFSKGNAFYLEYKDGEFLLVKMEEKKKFKSKSLHKNFFHGEVGGFHSIEVFENCTEKSENIDYLIFKMTLSPKGNAELGWINKGKNLRGKEVFERFNFVKNIFQPFSTYLWDDSYLENGAFKIPLRQLEAIQGKPSWYEKEGFVLFPCQNFPTIKKNFFISQSIESYEIAKNIISKTSLKNLQSYLHLPEKVDKLEKLRKKYLSAHAHPTIQSLAEKMQNELKIKERSFEDLSWFLMECLFFPQESNGATHETRALEDALRIIDTFRLFYRAEGYTQRT